MIEKVFGFRLGNLSPSFTH